MNETTGSKVVVGACWVVWAVAVGATGCVPTSADFKLARVGAGQAAIAGRLTITYNGQVFTENCFATFGGRKIKMTTDGIVLLAIPQGQTALERLDCQDVSNQHIRIPNVHFFAHGHGVVTDFGDVAVSWQAAGGFKISSLFGLIGYLVDEASDDGTASAEIHPPVPEVREAFRKQTGVEGVWGDPSIPVARAR